MDVETGYFEKIIEYLCWVNVYVEDDKNDKKVAELVECHNSRDQEVFDMYVDFFVHLQAHINEYSEDGVYSSDHEKCLQMEIRGGKSNDKLWGIAL